MHAGCMHKKRLTSKRQSFNRVWRVDPRVDLPESTAASSTEGLQQEGDYCCSVATTLAVVGATAVREV